MLEDSDLDNFLETEVKIVQSCTQCFFSAHRGMYVQLIKKRVNARR